MSKALIVRNTIKVNADAKRVWEVLTQPQWTRKYMFGCDVVSDWKVGHPVLWKAITDGQDVVYVKGQVVNVIPRKRLEYTAIGHNSVYEDIPSNYTTVTYELSSVDGKTVLSISQGDFMNVVDGQRRYSETVKGWNTALNDLKMLLNKS